MRPGLFQMEGDMAEPTKEELLARIADLEKQVEARKAGKLEFKVSEKGAVSVYGLGRFPTTLYAEQWEKLLDVAQELRAFIEQEKRRGSVKLRNRSE